MQSDPVGPPEGFENHCSKKWRSEECANFMRENGYEMLDGRWQKTVRVDENEDKNYDYFYSELVLNRMMKRETRLKGDTSQSDKGKANK